MQRFQQGDVRWEAGLRFEQQDTAATGEIDRDFDGVSGSVGVVTSASLQAVESSAAPAIAAVFQRRMFPMGGRLSHGVGHSKRIVRARARFAGGKTAPSKPSRRAPLSRGNAHGSSHMSRTRK